MVRYPDILELVPHEPPMLAVGALVEWQSGQARCEMTVPDDPWLSVDGTVDTVIGLEYMAQGVAACLGQEAFSGGGGVRVGMVVACRRLELGRPRLRVGERLTLLAERVSGNDDVSQFRTEARDARGAVVASALMTLVHADRPPE